MVTTCLALCLTGCSAGVKVGSSVPDTVGESNHLLSGGLFAIDADVPWVKAGASINPTFPSFGLFKPTVEVMDKNSSDSAKPPTAKASPVTTRTNPNGRGTLVASVPVDPCTLTQSPDQPTVPDVEAIGYASINAQNADDIGQRRLLAARASRLDAYRNLVEQVYGVQFSTDSAMLNTRLGEDSFHTRMDGSMCGATVVSIEPLGDDLYQTRLRLPGVVAAGLRAHGKTATL